MLKLRYSAKFKKDFKLIKKRGFDVRQLNAVIELLANGQQLPEQYGITRLSENTAGTGNATLLPAGCLST